MKFLVGPISSGFVNKYGCRAVTIAGTIIAGSKGFKLLKRFDLISIYAFTACLILSVFAKNVFTLYITIVSQPFHSLNFNND